LAARRDSPGASRPEPLRLPCSACLRRFAGRFRLLDILQRQSELVWIELLGFAAELHPLKLAQQMYEAVVLGENRIPLRNRGVPLGQRRSQPRFKRMGVGRRLIRVGAHARKRIRFARSWGEKSGRRAQSL
jgi:hypothetical protein